MASLTPTADAGSPAVGVREAQRLRTRARVFDAALAEFSRSGLVAADVSAIAAAAGVARGTFYFHFPTKEHVLLELERAEERKIAAELDTATTKPLASVLAELVRQVLTAERRLGPVIFRDMLGLHFTSTRPFEDALQEHPLVEFVISAVAQAQAAGRVRRDADPDELGVIFLTGLFALLATAGPASQERTALLERYVITIVEGMEAP